ncbi:MAG: hypothetical protein JF571_05395 [Asticcacaulis sp.]|nr:hypothetical protein [Asticcacaulis sp.]
MLSATERLNSDHEAPFRAFLRDVIANPADHTRFLNLLSLLEHIGSRKIMLSQMKGILTQDILKHLAEETRHAFFFKREAEKLAGHRLEGYSDLETLASGPGKLYFGRLDAGLTRDIGHHHAETGYLWVSLVVELRAIWVYRLYQQELLAAGYPLPLKSIIAEEDKHLVDMIDRLAEIGFDTAAALPAAQNLEKSLFVRLFAALRHGVTETAAA